MNAIKVRDKECRVLHSIDAFVDEELEPSQSIEVAKHLDVCRSCHEEVEMIRAVRRSLRRSTVRASSRSSSQSATSTGSSLGALSPEFIERMRLIAEKTAEEKQAGEDPSLPQAERVDGRGRMDAVSALPAAPLFEKEKSKRAQLASRIGWSAAVVTAAAAGFVVAFVGGRSGKTLPTSEAAALTNPTKQDLSQPLISRDEVASASPDAQSGGFDALIDRLVSFHANPPPAEVENYDDAVRRFEPFVGVHMQGSAFRQPFGAKFSGGRIYDIDSQRPVQVRYTAELRYTMPGHRITLYVFDPHAVTMRLTRLQPRVVRSHPIYLGKVRGFSVAAAEKSGVGYAMATDLDDEKTAQLVANFE